VIIKFKEYKKVYEGVPNLTLNEDILNENKMDKILVELSYQRKTMETNFKKVNSNIKNIDKRLTSVENILVNIIKKNNLKL